MRFVVSSLLPFPPLSWWALLLDASAICWDLAEHFEKMSFRNRYHIAGSNGEIRLSIPIQGGREQRTAVKDLLIANQDAWQRQHWRTLFSAYNRSAYFEHYAPKLEELFLREFDTLASFNRASFDWLCKQLRLEMEQREVLSYSATHPEALHDLRGWKPWTGRNAVVSFPAYQQVFSDRTGFIPDLSILDLLFAEGPHTLAWLRERKDEINSASLLH